MSFLADVNEIGGGGGEDFEFTGITSGGTLKKLWVWAGGWQIKAIKVWLTDGESRQYGNPDGTFSEFTFEDGEHFTSLSLWGNGAGTRLGGIKFTTTKTNNFFAHMTDWGLKKQYPIDTGSGICVGIKGNADEDINSLAFLFINTIKSTVLTDVYYPTLHEEIPKIAVEEIKSMIFCNDTSETQEHKIETSKKVIKTSSWSVTNKIECNFKFEVKAGIPEVAEINSEFGFTVGTESTSTLETCEEKNELFSFPVKVPPGKAVNVKITIGRTTVDLPYEGIVQITCFDDSVMSFLVRGIYKGVTYTDAHVDVSETEIDH